MRKFLKLGLLAMVVGLLGMVLLVWLYPVPEPNDVAVAETGTIYYADGTTVVAQVGDVRRTSIPLSEVPEHVQQAVLAAEDRSYYQHDGFSPQGLARAVVNNVSGSATQGGSTITQQYVKNVFLTQDQTIARKASELVLAIKLDLTRSKDDILEGYLNTIYFGRGAYGIEAASQAYYGHPAAELTEAEGAALAGIIQSPGNYEPELYPDALQQRFDYVIEGMASEGWITGAQAQSMRLPAFVPRDTSNKYGGQTGYIVEQVRAELLAQGFTDAEINGGGLRITTTIDPAAQRELAAAVDQAGPQRGTEGLRVGAASVDPQTGGILAMYGGPDYVTSPLNNATAARAQAGSTFKPFALAAAFEQDISPTSRWNGNSPRTIAGYTLENEGNKSYGTVTLRRATEKSINTAFVALADEIGIDRVMDAAYRAGLPQDTPGVNGDLTFVLGSASPTPLDMASAYATFAARGVYHAPHIVGQVTSRDGRVLHEGATAGEQRFTPEVADKVNDALRRVVTNGTATKAQAVGRPVAGKTGTTDDNKSAWFVGYGPQVSTAVMLAKEDAAGNPISLRGTGGLSKVFGSSFPLSIWTAYTDEYLQDKPVEEFVAPPRSTSSRTYGSGSGGSSSNWRRLPTASPSQPETGVEAPSPAPVEPPSTSAPQEPAPPGGQDPGSGGAVDPGAGGDPGAGTGGTGTGTGGAGTGAVGTG